MLFFTADEHYGHKRIIELQKRPFMTIEEMDREIIHRHNLCVRASDVVFHLGDFALVPKRETEDYICTLRGQHIFLKGSHDSWMNASYPERIVIQEGRFKLILSHEPITTPAILNSLFWNIHGHLHGNVLAHMFSVDVGVDNWNLYPVTLQQILDKVDNYLRLEAAQTWKSQEIEYTS